MVCRLVSAENIDPCNTGRQYAYGENIGWVNFEPDIVDPQAGATITDVNVTGFIWAENIGWINLNPNDDDPNTGINNDGTGKLSGWAWAENVGWISFSCTNTNSCNTVNYGVTIDDQGEFKGWAWAENIGWIHLKSSTEPLYGVRTSWVTTCEVGYDDLDKFVESWLMTGCDLPADLNHTSEVDFNDYALLAENWLDKCPPGWPLR